MAAAESHVRALRFPAMRLALADLVHERVFSLCMVLAVAAVVSPLLILFGVKNGAVETLRDRLTNDPRNREIRPVGSGRHRPAWFAELAGRDDVAFVIPATRSLAATVFARVRGSRAAGEPLDLIPSGPGDPLLLDNGAPAPQAGQCVLSSSAAELVGAKRGDVLTIEATRLDPSGAIEAVESDLAVVGIALPRAGAAAVVYAPLEFVDGVERYKDGLAVVEYGWSGQGGAEPVYDGAVVLFESPPSRIAELTAIQNTGLTRIETVPAAEVLDVLGYRPEAENIRLATTAGQPVHPESIQALARKLRAVNARVSPYIRPVEAYLVPRGAAGGDVAQHAAVALRVMAAEGEDAPGESVGAIRLPERVEIGAEDMDIAIPTDGGVLRVPVKIAPEHTGSEVALAPPRLAGMLRLAGERGVTYDPSSDAFLLERRAYASFRLYAKDIEDVASLAAVIEAQGIQVRTQEERIRDVLELDRYLGLIYWAIAAVGAAGGMGALLASMYASVERKRRELAVLRLLGFTHMELHAFPVTQSLTLAGGGFFAALAVYFVVALIIGGLFADRLQPGESLCRLAPDHALWAMAIALTIALVAGWLAARRASRVDPAEALRDE